MIELKIPKTFKVAGRRYDVSFHDNLVVEESLIGESNQNTGRVRLQSGLSPDLTAITFLHELLHAIDYVYLDKSLDEKQIAVLGNALYQVLGDMGIELKP